MRIIAGRFRRKHIRVPRGLDTRPSTDFTRESIFNLVQSRLDLDGASVLDLFAGTGALGLEALSRGAHRVTYVESNADVLKFIRQNTDDLQVTASCRFVRGDAVSYIQNYSGPPFQLIMADPPYELEAIPRLPDLVMPHLDPDGVFVLEHDVRFSFDDHPLLDTSRNYGRTIVSVFMPAAEDEEAEPED